MARTLVVLPLRPGARAQAEALLARLPWTAFLTEEDAVLIGDGPVLLGEEWDDVRAGQARFGTQVAPAADHASMPSVANVSYAATPGPGDSDGGDVYSP